MFLSVSGMKSGAIAGEAQDQTHKNEIEVLGWSWGMQAKTNLGGGSATTGKSTIRELRITKRVDKASTGLMSALRGNEMVKATLTLRKAGKNQLEYFVIKIEDARVTGLDIETIDVSNSPTLVERIALSFNKISIDYTPQGPDGQARGGTSFQDEWTINPQ